MELMQGKTLQDELDVLKTTNSLMKPDDIVIIMRKLIEGVKMMHINNVIHLYH